MKHLPLSFALSSTRLNRVGLVAGALAFSLLVACSAADSPAQGVTAVPASESPAVSDGDVASPTPMPSVSAPDEVPEGLEVVWEAYSLLAREYVDREAIDPDKLSEAAIRGMISAIGDRYTAYIPPDRFDVHQQDLEGDFEGIGAEVQPTQDGQHVMIVAPLPESPAEDAGIRPGDVILEVDGEDAEGWTVLDAVNEIRGPKGTTVTLTVRHIGEIDPVEIEIVRGRIEQNSVTARMLEESPYGVLRISSFTARTPDEVRDGIQDLRSQGAEGLILDLRRNPGGFLSSTVEVASEFLRDGLVTYEIDGQGNRTDWRVRPEGLATDIPAVILINEFSASGSEVFTAALQDHERAVVIGQKTFGKGSVNTVRELQNGGGLNITFARWYTPDGHLIEGDGVEPDVAVEYDPTTQSARHGQEDSQLQAAIKQLNFETGQTSGVS